MAPLLRDYISDLKRLRYASRRRPIGKVVVLSIHGYVSIYRRAVLHLIVIKSDANPACGATQPWALRRFFEMGSKNIPGYLPYLYLTTKLTKSTKQQI
jgi:hypothetical protein